MSRHNRRRTRGGHKTSDIPPTLAFSLPTIASFPRSSPFTSVTQQSTRRNDLSARHWQNRYLAWQVRERRQVEEREKLEADRRRIFGGESGERDEYGLCESMMKYFGTLDFIDNCSFHHTGP